MADKSDIIDWDELKWGSFTKQAYAAGFKKDELKDFAQYVLAHPKRYRDVTMRRARFYVNVIGRNHG